MFRGEAGPVLFTGRAGAIYRPGRADLELRGVRPHEGSQQLDRVVPGHVVLQRIYSCCSTLYAHMQLDRVVPAFRIQIWDRYRCVYTCALHGRTG
jgi:hypothetical protein